MRQKSDSEGEKKYDAELFDSDDDSDDDDTSTTQKSSQFVSIVHLQSKRFFYYFPGETTYIRYSINRS